MIAYKYGRWSISQIFHMSSLHQIAWHIGLPQPVFLHFRSCHTFAFALSSFALLISSCVSKFTILCAKIFTSRCRTDIRRGLYHMPPPKRSMENMTGKLLKLKTNLWWTGTCMMVWMALNRVSPRLKPLPSHSQAVTNSASRMERILS